MQLKRCTLGLCLLSITLISCAVILDDMAILLAGSTLAAGITGQYILFDRGMREIVASIEINRTLSRNPVRKGSTLNVTSVFKIRSPSRMHVRIEDLLPLNAVLVDGVTAVSTIPDASPQSHLCSYRFIPLVHGLQLFSGVSVSIRNLFFEDSIQLTRDADREPVISVLPTGVFAAPVSELSDGSRDNRKISVHSSADVHSLREYSVGDDLRHADWKISAKYNKIFIRKYSGLMSHPPLIIVDLPWSGAPWPEKEFNRMLSEVTGMVRHTIETYQHVSVLLISGPNILHLIREEKNITRCIADLREWMHPAERPVHFYHMPDRSDLRSHIRDCEDALEQTADSQTHTFYLLLRDRYKNILQYQRAPVFSEQVGRSLSRLTVTEAYLYSLGLGDTSHIRHVVRPLQSQNIRVHIRIVDASVEGKSAAHDYPRATRRVRS